MLYLRVHVQPNASKNEIISYIDGILKLRIAAPAVNGKANRKLIEYLSGFFHTPKSNITLKSGLSSSYKTLVVDGISPQELLRFFESKSKK